MKNKIADIIKRKLEHLCCTDCYKLKNNIPDCYECNPRWRISDDYATEIANEIIRKGVNE